MSNMDFPRIICALCMAGVLLATACASTPASRLSEAERSALAGRSVVFEQKTPVHFSLVSSSGTVLAGLLGPFSAGIYAAKAGHAGDMLVKRDSLTDPSTVIAPALLSDLQQWYAMTAPSSEGSAPIADYALSIDVTNWSTMYLPGRMSQYGVMLVVNAQIKSVKTLRTFRSAKCVIRPRNAPDAPTLAELLENDGARLRVEIDYANHACLDALGQSLLGHATTPQDRPAEGS